MATITTTTATSGFSYPVQSCMDRSPITGELWVVAKTATTTIALFKSTDNGASWGSQGSFTRANLTDLGEMRIDQAGDHIHLTYQTFQSSEDRVYYKRIDIRSGTADLGAGEMFINAGNALNDHDNLSASAVAPYKNPDGSYAVVVAVAFHGTTHSGLEFFGVSIKNDGLFTTYLNNGIIKDTREYSSDGNDTSVSVSLDFEHNGDGVTVATPNLWAGWQINGVVNCLKLSWQGYKSGWKTPTYEPQVATGRPGTRDIPARWDGARFMLLSKNSSDGTKMDVYERNTANTGNTVKRTTPSHTTGVITQSMLSYNHVTKDLRVFAVGTSTAVVYYIDFNRLAGTWGSWVVANATAAIAGEWGVRRSTYGTNAFDVYHQTGAGSPWTLSNYILGVNFAPTAPTWITGTAGTVTTNGAAFDVSSSLLLDWNFNDPNATDTQGWFALSRQIGVAAVQYYRTSDNTWQVAEVQNASATSSITLTTGQWLGGGGAADPAHVYKVKTWDAAGQPSTYSDALSLVPSTRVDPTLTAPTASQVLNSGLVVANWTCADQASYKVTLTNVATGVLVHDSGFINDPGGLTSGYSVPLILPDGFSGSLTLQTKNGEFLPSVIRTVAFSVDFVEPVAPAVVPVAAAASGGINVTITQAAPTGAQPATNKLSIWRRKVVSTTPTNANPYFETNTTDWTNVNYASMVRSTAQFHQGVASLFTTPNGSQATPYSQTTGYATAGGARWEGRGWARSTTTNKTIRMRLQWYDSGVSLISETTRDFTPVATTWIFMSMTGTAPSNAVTVRLAIGQIATPAAGDTMYVDEMVLIPANDDLGIRIESGVLSGSVNLDWRAVTGINYEYRGDAAGANATQIYGPWSS